MQQSAQKITTKAYCVSLENGSFFRWCIRPIGVCFEVCYCGGGAIRTSAIGLARHFSRTSHRRMCFDVALPLEDTRAAMVIDGGRLTYDGVSHKVRIRLRRGSRRVCPASGALVGASGRPDTSVSCQCLAAARKLCLAATLGHAMIGLTARAPVCSRMCHAVGRTFSWPPRPARSRLRGMECASERRSAPTRSRLRVRRHGHEVPGPMCTHPVGARLHCRAFARQHGRGGRKCA